MPPLRILISRPDRIGDVVLSTPLPREIKRKFPDCFVAVLLKEYTKDIYLNNPYVDAILLKDDNHSINEEINTVREVRKFKFTHAFMLLPSERINWILTLSGIKKRFGSGHKLFQFITNTKSVFRNKYVPLRHESDYCLDFIRKINIEPEDHSSEIYLSEEEKLKVSKIRSELSSNGKPVIGINTTSGNSAPNWKVEDYKILIKLLTESQRFNVVITDLKPDAGLAELDNIVFRNKDLKLRESILNFAALDVLISASTGPMHICAGLKVPTISLFCPLTACSPQLWGPMGNKNIVVLPEENYCSVKCPGDPKMCTFHGTGGISPEQIYNEILNFFINE